MNRRATDRHATLRIECEEAAGMLVDALDMFLWGTCSRDLLVRTLEHLRVMRERVRIHEAEYGIDLDRDAARRTVSEIVLAAEVAHAIEHNGTATDSCAAASTGNELGHQTEGTQHGGPAHLLSASARHFNGE